MELKKKVGSVIRARREERKLSQAALGKLVGTTQQTISNAERGIYGSTREILSILNALGISPDDLDSGASTDVADRIYAMIQRQPQEEQERVEQLLKVLLEKPR